MRAGSFLLFLLSVLPRPAAAQLPLPSEGEAGGPASPSAISPAPPGPGEAVRRDEDGHATVRAFRVPEPLDIDGNLDEAFYEVTPAVSGFIQSVPIEGAEPSERTEAWIGFDDTHVYASARMWDSAPESEWVASELVRDSRAIRSNDHFGVFLDTFFDRRNSVVIYVNPLGGFNDMQITNEGSPNRDWNPVLNIRTGRFEGGWTVEIAIPFRALRYRSGAEQVWGIQLRRNVMRRNEWHHLTYLPLSVAGNGSQGVFRVSMYGTLVGIEAPPASRNLEVKPYAISGVETDLTTDPAISNDGHWDAGLDVKYSITENLTADLTFNTDFAQVEVDEQQVNLTRFSLFFPEKREFFLEGRGIFDFGRGGNFGGGLPGGRGGGGGRPGGGSGGGGFGGGGAPTLFYSRQIGLQDGEAVPILGGGKVTGKVGSFDVGAVAIRTDEAHGAEPTNFSILRLRRDIFARSSIGVLFGDRSNSVAAETGSNQAYGVDASLAFFENLSFVTSYAKTRTDGLGGNDESYQARFNYAADLWGARASHLLVGDDFNPEIGFVRRRGFRQSSLSGRFSPRPASIEAIRRINFQADLDYFENERLGYVESRSRLGVFQIELENGDFFDFRYTDTYEHLPEETRISGALIPDGRYPFQDVQVRYGFGPQRPVSGSVSVKAGKFYSGDLLSVGLGGARVEVMPELTLEPSIEFNWVDLPDLQARDGEFNQHVARLRTTYSLSPRTFVSGLVQYNDGSGTFSANVRLRWEWAPGSELFVVYTEDRETDVLDRWSDLSTRGFVVKVNRLLQL